MYAEEVTNSMSLAINESNRRRNIHLQYNKINKITPKSIKKNLNSNISSIYNIDYSKVIYIEDCDIPTHELLP